MADALADAQTVEVEPLLVVAVEHRAVREVAQVLELRRRALQAIGVDVRVPVDRRLPHWRDVLHLVLVTQPVKESGTLKVSHARAQLDAARQRRRALLLAAADFLEEAPMKFQNK